MAKTEKFTGIQKAAILFISLGPDASAAIIKRLNERDIQKITYEIANMSSVKAEDRQAILDEFMELNKAKDYILEGGVEYARSVLAKALGTQKANDILERVTEFSQQFRPFSIARKADATQLMNVISGEHPQTIALILCHLQPDKAGQIMSALPSELQSEVAFRVATMSNIYPVVVKEIEEVLNSKLSSVVTSESTVIGGVQSLVNILNQVDRTTEKNITEGLEREDMELADKVKESMFVFEDIITINDVEIQRILREVDNKELCMALKGTSEQVIETISRNLSKRAAATLKEDMEFLGPVRLMDVEKAQQKIVALIRRLDEAGEITIVRGGDDALIL
ncbi:flagellar motor switch protein FliG [Clostridium sulfidigenes]|uniref:Flagellar motor switch protein FliG n=1 Tax=Clostridium sulfidigenes TaxID=318464 RepID=A0A084JIN3_9CLOT|nr:flagellar motor switch protein FliG [Clostridium sulfidigenes]KEZ88817.1 flagellar motor switch protein FliG [Clostridium sulfidigenes]HAR84189.1 flagellar motor switch protein FliG [Clostridium sp.]HCO74460.1 flagellar motor switch protein FliG [Clostridium sp.]